MKAFDIKDSVIFDTMKVNSINLSKNQVSIDPKAYGAEKLESQFKNIIATSKKKQFTEKLWFCGQLIGEVSGNLTFFNLPILY